MERWQQQLAALAARQGIPSRFRGFLPRWERGDGGGFVSVQAQSWCSALGAERINSWSGNSFEAYAPGGFPPGFDAGMELDTELPVRGDRLVVPVRGYLTAAAVQRLLDAMKARLPADARIRLEL